MLYHDKQLNDFEKEKWAETILGMTQTEMARLIRFVPRGMTPKISKLIGWNKNN